MPTHTHTPAELARARRVLASLKNETGCTDGELAARRAKVAAMEAEYGLGGHGSTRYNSASNSGANAPNEEPVEPLAPNLYPLSTKVWRAPPVVWHPKQRPFVRPYVFSQPAPARPTLRQRFAAVCAAWPTFYHAVKAGLAAASVQQ